jgi:hypothetical protein
VSQFSTHLYPHKIFSTLIKFLLSLSINTVLGQFI